MDSSCICGYVVVFMYKTLYIICVIVNSNIISTSLFIWQARHHERWVKPQSLFFFIRQLMLRATLVSDASHYYLRNNPTRVTPGRLSKHSRSSSGRTSHFLYLLTLSRRDEKYSLNVLHTELARVTSEWKDFGQRLSDRCLKRMNYVQLSTTISRRWESVLAKKGKSNLIDFPLTRGNYVGLIVLHWFLRFR